MCIRDRLKHFGVYMCKCCVNNQIKPQSSFVDVLVGRVFLNALDFWVDFFVACLYILQSILSMVEVGKEACLPAQNYNQFQFQIHKTTIFNGYSDQITDTACLNFFTVVTGVRKHTTLPIYTAPTYSTVHKHYTKSKLQLKKES